LLPQIRALHDPTHGEVASGLFRVIQGVVKKALIADYIGLYCDLVFDTPVTYNGFEVGLALYGYAFQIYFDFSGYSDIAIGLGLMIGFHFPVNFDGPYRATSITDFWRRWHISLSTWLRDYLYVPLGGNRKGAARTYVNLALVMLLGGLWHGANWTFVAWGAWHGLWLIIERAFGRRPWPFAASRAVQAATTFVLVLIGWVFFRAADLGDAFRYLASMAGAAAVPGAGLDLRPIHIVALMAAAAIAWGLPPSHHLLARFRPWWTAALQPVWLLALLHLDFQHHVPFLYYQF
jgi:alginate O-acetyltransferase complex protein AlgI